eukprot:TRINITY_DN8318_c0_g1_i2.p1 TRINITY_DN8318_c0_g1~~TRINITY_DN8318_c0_g1_i2.p1  ORF type:complete len:148 (+),score=10.49 TRINITY_DN8318_c0_g1_i2:401-844(+)
MGIVDHPGRPQVRLLKLMEDLPGWKPKEDRASELCDLGVVSTLVEAGGDADNNERLEASRRVLSEDNRAQARLDAGVRVCPEAACAECGHFSCHAYVDEDPSDLGGWGLKCCSRSCECRYCVYTRTRLGRTHRDPTAGYGCCKCGPT